jgi:putative phosphoribosyl transferase
LKRGGPRFAHRREAGRRLAAQLEDVAGAQPVVYGIARGGVVVGAEVAEALGCPLDVVVVRKLGYPGHEEAGFGALGEGGVLVPEDLVSIPAGDRAAGMIREAVEREQEQVRERVRLYRGERQRISAAGRTAIVVDDGIATGYTFAAGLGIVGRDRPQRLIGAAPVGAAEGVRLVGHFCDEVRTLHTTEPRQFFAVSMHYRRFGQVDDEEVAALLEAARGPAQDGG